MPAMLALRKASLLSVIYPSLHTFVKKYGCYLPDRISSFLFYCFKRTRVSFSFSFSFSSLSIHDMYTIPTHFFLFITSHRWIGSINIYIYMIRILRRFPSGYSPPFFPFSTFVSFFLSNPTVVKSHGAYEYSPLAVFEGENKIPNGGAVPSAG